MVDVGLELFRAGKVLDQIVFEGVEFLLCLEDVVVILDEVVS